MADACDDNGANHVAREQDRNETRKSPNAQHHAGYQLKDADPVDERTG